MPFYRCGHFVGLMVWSVEAAYARQERTVVVEEKKGLSYVYRACRSLAINACFCLHFATFAVMKLQREKPSILLIYTGGTIGMYENPETGALQNYDFRRLIGHVPEIKKFGYDIDVYTFEPPIDSSDMQPRDWIELVHIISSRYDEFDGFVVLHGTDTMAYTASALSFMLEGLGKPVVFTGSQLPIGMLRTDGKENLLTSIEIAAARREDGSSMVPEVCVFFENKLLRGNRTTKINAEGFNAFRSYNYPPLAEVGIHIKYNTHYIHYPAKDVCFKPHYLMDNNLVVLTLFPGIRREAVMNIVGIPGLRAVVLKTYGSGNAPQMTWFIELLRQLEQRHILVVNITQCSLGTVEMERYTTGQQLLQTGIINGYDSTVEGMITKLMFLLGHNYSHRKIRMLMNQSVAGEVTIETPTALLHN